MKRNELNKTLKAAENMDWGQVISNGGSPCFALMKDGYFCGRAERWPGHDTQLCPKAGHGFIPLNALIESVTNKDLQP